MVWDRFLAGDTSGVLSLLDPEVEIHEPPDLPGADVYHGHEGWQRQIAKFREAFEQIDYRVLEHIDCGDSVITVVEATGTGTGSEITGTVRYAELEDWRCGKVVSIRYFMDKDAALEAAAESD